MDFTLDTGFGKISSFNIDMSDLDISSPCKKDRKSKETSKEEFTVAVNKKKGDGFNFSFDFELDNFGFGSSQESKGKAKNNQERDSFSFWSTQESREEAKNDQEKKCSSSKRSGNEGSGSHLNEDIGSLEDGLVQKHTASEAGMTLTIDSHVDIDKSHVTTKHSLPSNHAMSNNETPKLQSASNEVVLEKANSSLQEKVSSSTHKTVCQVEGGTPLISHSESRRDNSSCLQDHVNSVAADVSFLGVGTDGSKKGLLDSDTNYDKSVSESPSLEDVATSMKNASETRNFENDKHVLETSKDRTETHSNSMSNATEDNMQDMKVGNEIQSPTSELSPSSLSKSKFFMPSVKPAAQMQTKTSFTETKVSALSNKRIGPIAQRRPDEIIKLGTNPDTPRTVLQKNLKSLKTVDQHGGFKAILQAKDNFTETLKQMPVNLSTKRKVPETNSDSMILLPSKRLSQSPNGSRGSSECTERICNKQVNDHEHSGNGNNKTTEYENCQISLRDLPMSMNIKELGSPSAIEDDDNIKNAQALSKDLDDVQVFSLHYFALAFICITRGSFLQVY
ncbi:hypothetical protein K7X08_033209 [Anisodus acutangulus]|uniref:Uncharacterized protein n=1 Tax=Anisodus acutangulus TaxID=402998 RepID=A0A9Q1M162_9SOLA|nr:hypothetical protein K7X08_033209 [Anisodus acutangulus]